MPNPPLWRFSSRRIRRALAYSGIVSFYRFCYRHTRPICAHIRGSGRTHTTVVVFQLELHFFNLNCCMPREESDDMGTKLNEVYKAIFTW